MFDCMAINFLCIIIKIVFRIDLRTFIKLTKYSIYYLIKLMGNNTYTTTSL